MTNPFVFVPRCVPVDLFDQYLRLISSKFPNRRIVVFESNPAYLNRYDSNVSTLPFPGKRFMTEQMLSEVEDKVQWNACAAILIPLTGNTTHGFEQLVQFADRASNVPAFLITPDNTLTEVIRSKQTPSAGDAVSSRIGDSKVNMDVLSDSALLGRIGGGLNRSYLYRDDSLYVFGWLDDGGRFGPQELRVFADDDEKRPLPAVMLRCGYPDPAVSIRGEHLGVAIFVPPIRKSVTALRVCYPGGGETRFVLRPNPERFETLLGDVAAEGNFCRSRRDLSAAERENVDWLFGGLMEDINARFHEGIGVAEELQLGVIADASVSLVIPIHKSYELVRHQFAHLAADDFVKRQEIICILTSVNGGVEEVAKFKHLMRRIYLLYAVPCRVLIANRNCSFSVACNLGASASRGRYILMLNSDVFPKSQGWLEKMIATIQSDPTIGIVGARLLYPDGSIQHVAMDWRREPACDNLLINVHPYKGMHPSLVPVDKIAEVGAVTAACMLVRRDEFIGLGMFDTGFIRGDCEDSDYCLRASAAGYRIVCDNRAELYHLEGASYRPEARRLLFHYNTARQEKRWGAVIAERTALNA